MLFGDCQRLIDRNTHKLHQGLDLLCRGSLIVWTRLSANVGQSSLIKGCGADVVGRDCIWDGRREANKKEECGMDRRGYGKECLEMDILEQFIE